MDGTPEGVGGTSDVPADEVTAAADDLRVEEMERESSPASDPPSSWAGRDPEDRPTDT